MWTAKTKLLFIILGAPIVAVVFGTIRQGVNPSRQQLEATFGYDFYELPKMGEAFVWKIPRNEQTYKRENYSSGFVPFQEDEIYLIFTKVVGCVYMMFYHLGASVTVDDKKHAAKIAVTMQHLVRDLTVMNVKISREVAPYESELYKVVINRLKKTAQAFKRPYDNYLDENKVVKPPGVYLIKGTDFASRCKKVAIQPHLMKKDLCVLVDTGSCHTSGVTRPTMIYCGREIPKAVKSRATIVSNHFQERFDTWDDGEEEQAVVDDNKKAQPERSVYSHQVHMKFEKLMETLKNCEHTRPYEVETSNNEDSNGEEFVQQRDRDVKVFEYYSENGEIKTNEVPNNVPVSSATVIDSKSSYLLDSSSVAGFFLTLGKDAKLDEKIYAIEKAEQHVHNVADSLQKSVKMSIEFEVWLRHTFDFKINLTDLYY